MRKKTNRLLNEKIVKFCLIPGILRRMSTIFSNPVRCVTKRSQHNELLDFNSLNVLIKFSPAQRKMLETEYYVNKNFYGRDKLYASLKRKHGDAAPTQKAINDWLLQQETHQLHRRQFQSQTITPIKNVRVPNQLWMADLIDLTSRADNGFKWALTVVDVFSKFAWAVPMKNKQNQTVTAAMADIHARCETGQTGSRAREVLPLAH